MRGRIVTAPDGTRWRVRRRWLDRPAPKPWTGFWRRRTRKDDAEAVGEWGLWGLVDGLDTLEGVLAIAAAAIVLALLVLLLLSVLGIALELALLAFVLGSGAFGRLVLRRPWTIEAVGLDEPAGRSAFAVSGWRRSRRTLAALAAAIETTGPPAALPEAEPLYERMPA